MQFHMISKDFSFLLFSEKSFSFAFFVGEKRMKLERFPLPFHVFCLDTLAAPREKMENCWRFYRNLRTIHNRKRAQWRLPIFTHVWKIPFTRFSGFATRTFSAFSQQKCMLSAVNEKRRIMNNCFRSPLFSFFLKKVFCGRAAPNGSTREWSQFGNCC